MEKKCFIIGAGDFFEKNIPAKEGDFIIAADGGLDSLLKIGKRPDLFVGDRDSSSSDTKIIDGLYFPTHKDDSDTLLAVKEGMNRGFKLFYILGGTGGRCDHTVANIKTLEFLAEENCMGFLFFEKQVMTVIRDSSITLPEDFKGYFSVFPIGGKCEGVTIKGGEYELEGACLESSCSMGLSNDFIGKEVFIEVKNGKLTVIFERQGEYIFE